jgi:N-acetylglutamate synthase-like GNAT family acetyltransferase
MKITRATIEHSKQISQLMLSELNNPNPKFPKEMINKFREHAKEENIIKEFENPGLIAFVAIISKRLVGFIVGYKDLLINQAMIHYITADGIIIKEKLLKRFIKECKSRNIDKIITDTFEFMDNKDFFESNGFVLTKKEKLTPNLEMFWYEVKLT